jgi:hypothetical protein
MNGLDKLENNAEFGDQYGFLQRCLFRFCFYCSCPDFISLQRIELQDQREELQLQRKAIDETDKKAKEDLITAKAKAKEDKVEAENIRVADSRRADKRAEDADKRRLSQELYRDWHQEPMLTQRYAIGAFLKKGETISLKNLNALLLLLLMLLIMLLLLLFMLLLLIIMLIMLMLIDLVISASSVKKRNKIDIAIKYWRLYMNLARNPQASLQLTSTMILSFSAAQASLEKQRQLCQIDHHC